MNLRQKWLTFLDGSAIGIEDRGTHRVLSEGCRYVWFLADSAGTMYPGSAYDSDLITFDSLIGYCAYLLEAWQNRTDLGVPATQWEVVLAWIDTHLPELSIE